MESNDLAQNPSEQPHRPMSKMAMLGTLLVGAVIGGMAVEFWLVRRGTPAPAAQTAATGDVAADVAHLKSVLPTQSHTMKDVGDHWVNLWFAAEKRNWALARFYFDQARQQAKWTIAIRPERLKRDGSTVNLKGLLTATDMSVFADVQLAIEDQNHQEFVAAYKAALVQCHACHTAVDMPFLQPAIPTVQPSTAVPFEPPK